MAGRRRAAADYMRRFLGSLAARGRMKQDAAQWKYRYPCSYGPSRATICAMSLVLAALPVGYAIVTGLSDWLGVAALLATFGGGTAFIVLVARIERRKRHLACAAGRIMHLAASLPRRTDEETLAILGEIRACYSDACRLVGEIGSGGDRRLADDLRGRLDRIDRAYDAETGLLRLAEASVDDFATDVRAFSRKVDVLKIVD